MDLLGVVGFPIPMEVPTAPKGANCLEEASKGFPIPKEEEVANNHLGPMVEEAIDNLAPMVEVANNLVPMVEEAIDILDPREEVAIDILDPREEEEAGIAMEAYPGSSSFL